MGNRGPSRTVNTDHMSRIETIRSVEIARLRHAASSHMSQNKIQRHEWLHRMRVMRSNIVLQLSSTRLPMHANNIHLLRIPLLSLALLLRPIIILQLPPQPSNNILNPSLALLKRKIPTPIPPPRFLIRLQRSPFPQFRELRFTQRFVRGIRVGEIRGRPCGGLCAGCTAARNPVVDAGIEFCAEKLLEGVCLCSTWVFWAWVGD